MPGTGLEAQDQGLVARYTFDEGPGGVVKDWSGNGNGGKNRGAKYVEAPGAKGLANAYTGTAQRGGVDNH